jgi:glycosyltransferase 2 family protein
MTTTAIQPNSAPSPAPGRNLWKTVPGLLISAFFLWYTFRNISFAEIRALRLVTPVWIAGVLAFTAASYTLRCVRWTRMMRSTGARFGVCARVLMTSLAANNILPFRIGDIMRVFTYAPDLGASPSAILSTVILEKLLDVFVVGLMFVLTMGKGLPVKVRDGADTALAISTVGLLILVFGARQLETPVRALFARLPQNKLVQKLEHWLLLAIDTLRQMGIAGSLLLLIQTVVIWTCEAMIYVSAVRLIGISVDRIGPWEAVSFGNLSYMLPSSPGAIGTFEWAVKASLVSHGAQASQAALFALALHAWLLIAVTGVGGIIFLIHRAKIHNHTPLLEEIETLPTKLP